MGDFQRFSGAAGKSGFRSTNFAGENPNAKAEQDFAPSRFMNTHTNPSTQQEDEVSDEQPEIDIGEIQQEAYDLGTQDAREQLEPRIQSLEQQLEIVQPLIQQLVSMRKEALEQAADDVAKIVRLVARRVVGDSLAYNPDALPTLVKNAISQMPDEDEIVIKVAPDDVACVQDALEEIYRNSVVASESIEAGCVVETRFASIDSSLDAVVTGLEAAVAEWLESQNA